MRHGHTAILICLDETASMEVVRDATISAFNEFIQDQRKVAGTAEVWLLRFNTLYNHLERPSYFADLGGVMLLTRENYVPRANTPLYDAVGTMVDAVGKEFAGRPDHERPEKVVMLIQTDGEENSSREYTSHQVREMIERQQKDYNWKFVFLGAAQEAWVAGQMMGIHRSSTIAYDHTGQGTGQVMMMASAAASSYRSGESDTMSFIETDIREETDPQAFTKWSKKQKEKKKEQAS